MNSLNKLQPALATGTMASYIASVNQVPMLSLEQEQELSRRFLSENDLEAARQLVVSHLRFVVKIARGYNGYGLQLADLVQEGSVGLMKAVKRFDPDVGVRLAAFAVHWIRAEMHEFILRNWRIVKIATTKAQRKLFFNLRSSKKRLGWLNQNEINEVAQDLGVKPSDVVEMEQRLNNNYDIALDGGHDNEKIHTPAYSLEDKNASPAELMEKAQDDHKYQKALTKAMESLDERSQSIITRRWLKEDKTTLNELATEYGISAERIRQIEHSAMKKMRGVIRA